MKTKQFSNGALDVAGKSYQSAADETGDCLDERAS